MSGPETEKRASPGAFNKSIIPGYAVFVKCMQPQWRSAGPQAATRASFTRHAGVIHAQGRATLPGEHEQNDADTKCQQPPVLPARATTLSALGGQHAVEERQQLIALTAFGRSCRRARLILEPMKPAHGRRPRRGRRAGPRQARTEQSEEQRRAQQPDRQQRSDELRLP